MSVEYVPYPPDPRLAAEAMLWKAGMQSATQEQKDVLAEDIAELAGYDPERTVWAFNELTKRIGGFANLASYIACLIAGTKARGRATREVDPDELG